MGEPSEDARRIAELEQALDVADGFIDASPVAMWCIEYTEPVDLTVGEQEIVRQVFENDCHWRMCNRAMARLYNLPEELDFNRQRVSSYFPRSPENEAFIRQVIDAGYHIDAAPAIDARHDGTLMHVENSVRCRIEDNELVRMWGTVRDITESRLAHNRLVQREQEVNAILSALPDAVIVVDSSGQVLAVNPAFETTFGRDAEAVLGNPIAPLLDLSYESDGGSRIAGQFSQRWSTTVTAADNRQIECEVRMAPLRTDDLFRGFVLSLRPLPLESTSRKNRTPAAPRRGKQRA